MDLKEATVEQKLMELMLLAARGAVIDSSLCRAPGPEEPECLEESAAPQLAFEPARRSASSARPTTLHPTASACSQEHLAAHRHRQRGRRLESELELVVGIEKIGVATLSHFPHPEPTPTHSPALEHQYLAPRTALNSASSTLAPTASSRPLWPPSSAHL